MAQRKPYVSSAARSAIQKALAQYAPGDGYGKGIEAGLERGRIKSTASGMQNLVSAGLASTTMAGGLGKKYEEEVAAPTRAQMESTRAQAIAALQSMLAQMEQGGYQSALSRSSQEFQTMLGMPRSSSSPAPTAPIASTAPVTQGQSYLPTVPNIARNIMSSAKSVYSQPPEQYTPPKRYTPPTFLPQSSTIPQSWSSGTILPTPYLSGNAANAPTQKDFMGNPVRY